MLDPEFVKKLEGFESRILDLEKTVMDHEYKIGELETEIKYLNRRNED